MTETTVLTDSGAIAVEARWLDGRPWIDAPASRAALGWEVKAQGLCRDAECVLLDGILEDGALDLLEAADRVGRPVLADPEASLVVVGAETGLRQQALAALDLPDVGLATLSGERVSLRHWAGKKKLFAVFASW